MFFKPCGLVVDLGEFFACPTRWSLHHFDLRGVAENVVGIEVEWFLYHFQINGLLIEGRPRGCRGLIAIGSPGSSPRRRSTARIKSSRHFIASISSSNSCTLKCSSIAITNSTRSKESPSCDSGALGS